MDKILDFLCEFAKIPAPSNDEGLRAEYIKKWLENEGAEGVYIDGALNVVYPIGNTDGDLYVFMAHSDVVFPDKTPLPLEIRDGRIYCPGVGDDSAHVVCMLTAIKDIIKNKLTPKNCGVLIVVNSCEEGLGNLKGCREIMRVYGDRVREFITFDGVAFSPSNKPVGSRRFEVEIKTEGGHSYQAFGNKNAIACMASLIDTLYKIKVPEIGKTTYNVGIIEGGTSVNTIAQNAKMMFEFRSDEREALDIMQAQFDDALSHAEGELSVRLIGDRPCAGEVDMEIQNKMCERVGALVKKYYDTEPEFRPASTDCNVPSSMGIPSVCVGLVDTKGAHTREEYVEIYSLEKGVMIAKELIMEKF